MDKISPPSNGKVAVVTGASSGIGAATARKLAEQGFVVILIARREERLKALAEDIGSAGGRADFLAVDLADEQGGQAVYNHIMSTYGCPEVLVNNAGFGWYGYGDHMPWSLARQMIAINMVALAQLTLLFLPAMKENGRGQIINISSVVGSLPSQGVALYSATKSFVDTFTTSLHREARGSGVQISVIKPGAVTTPFYDVIEERSRGRRIPVDRLAISPDAVANRIWDLVRRPRRIVYIPRILAIVPWIELCLGWLIDRLGPLLLRREPGTGI